MTERDVNMRAMFSEMSYITLDVIPVSPYSLVKRTTNKYDINDLNSIHYCSETMHPATHLNVALFSVIFKCELFPKYRA